MSNISSRLRMRRKELNISLCQLAKGMGVHHSVISRIELGVCDFSKHIFEIAEHLDVEAEWLVKGHLPKEREWRNQYLLDNSLDSKKVS